MQIFPRFDEYNLNHMLIGNVKIAKDSRIGYRNKLYFEINVSV